MPFVHHGAATRFTLVDASFRAIPPVTPDSFAYSIVCITIIALRSIVIGSWGNAGVSRAASSAAAGERALEQTR